jgi:beta-lactamase class A
MHNLSTEQELSTFRLLFVFGLLAALLTMQFSPAAYAQKAVSGAKERIEDLIKTSGAESVGVAFFDLATGEELLVNPDESFHAASTMKVPVMMELYRQAKAGKFSLEDRLPIKNDFLSIADGSHFSIDAGSDSEPTLYKRLGEQETIRRLMRLMIDMSSNLATNILIERVGAKNVMALMRSMGANKIQVLRGVEDSKAFEHKMNNTTTARDLMIVFRRIAERRAVSAKASDEMIKVMLAQHFNESIPAGVAKDAKVAHKTGSITKISHDAAIVYPPHRKPYVLVVLTRGFADEKRAHQLIADISRVVYERVAN